MFMPKRGSYALPQTLSVFQIFAAARGARGWSQVKLAEIMHTSQGWICDTETGRRADPQMSTLIRMADALGVKATLKVEDPVTGDTWHVCLSSPDPD
jgi:transcriptional regulator with XRE-family HTH domain